MVKQFSNKAIDNFFSFFYKIVDFFKVLLDVFYAFLDIWAQFFGIFGNLFLYCYYLVLFIIDKSTENRGRFFTWRRIQVSKAYMPAKAYNKDIDNPIPAMYGVTKKTVESTVSTAKSMTSSAVKATGNIAKSASESTQQLSRVISVKPSGGKINFWKRSAETFIDIVQGIQKLLVKPFKFIINIFANKLQPVKEDEANASKGASLIEEYMREYEKKRR